MKFQVVNSLPSFRIVNGQLHQLPNSHPLGNNIRDLHIIMDRSLILHDVFSIHSMYIKHITLLRYEHIITTRLSQFSNVSHLFIVVEW